MHLCDLANFSAEALSRASLARPEALFGPMEEVRGYGRAWCLTAVDALLEQSSVAPRRKPENH